MKCRLVTNIPTPYRNHCYELLHEAFSTQGVHFEVAFMATTEYGRHWTFAPGELRYPHTIYRGAHPRVRGAVLHANPRLIFELATHAPEILIVAGYSSPSHALGPFCAPAGTTRLLWSETNPESEQNAGRIVRGIKRFLVSPYDGFIVPGPRSQKYLQSLAPSQAHLPFISFPNLIDKAVFVGRVDAHRAQREALRGEFGVRGDTQLWVCPARLEAVKGLDAFLPLLAGLEGVTLLVAGDGAQRKQLEELIEQRKLPVRLLGQQNERAIVRLYAAADLFVLPSRSDPSPLSPVEACAAGLPVYVSDRAGNVEDVVDEGTNGWTYDASDPGANRERIHEIARTSLTRLTEMGAASRGLYMERFDSHRLVQRLVDEVLSLHAQKSLRNA